jgi:hypothetical protein
VPFGRAGCLGASQSFGLRRQASWLKVWRGGGCKFSATERAHKRNGGRIDAECRQPSLVTTSGVQLGGAFGVRKIMSQPLGKLYIPPFSGVRLVECREHFQIVPVPAVKVMHGYGKIKASQATMDYDDPKSEPIWDDLGLDEEVWAVMEWYQFEDGNQVPGSMCFLRPECTEDQVKKRMEDLKRFSSLTREDLLQLTQIFEAKEEDFQYIEDRHPNYQDEPDPSDTEKYDVYHARLKVMSDLQPKTVELIKIANATKDPVKRQIVEREAVQSYFAELAAHYFTEDEIKAWQRSNPIGTGWMCEFGAVMREPRRQTDRQAAWHARTCRANQNALRPGPQLFRGQNRFHCL